MQFFSFDAAYLERLREGDPATERHFSEYFGELILIKLRARQFNRHMVEDIRQETFLRVLQAIRKGNIRDPQRIGSFVNSVCNNVSLELGRSASRTMSMEDGPPDIRDDSAGAEAELVTREMQREVRTVLSQLSAKNRKLLSAIFLEERPSEEVCRDFGVDGNYLRVLMFRARAQFRKAMDNIRTGTEKTG